jgi:hypothetical protein
MDTAAHWLHQAGEFIDTAVNKDATAEVGPLTVAPSITAFRTSDEAAKLPVARLASDIRQAFAPVGTFVPPVIVAVAEPDRVVSR